MTSKSLFFRRMKQDLEQRIWLPVIFFIIGFLSLELPLIARFDMWQQKQNYEFRATTYLMDNFFSPGSLFIMVTIGVAIISALSGFVYMHSSKKLDVYHSIPIKRETLFMQQYIYGIIYYLVPMVLHLCICFGICGANGVFGAGILLQALGFLMIQLLVYLACYAVVILAICLTGNIVVSVLGSAVLLVYTLMISLLKELVCERFFMTYSGIDNQLSLPAISPIHLFYKLMLSISNSETSYLAYTDHLAYFVKFLFAAVVYTIIALTLYRKRPTEVAGKSMAFSRLEPVVKTMIVLPVSIVSGYIFTAIATDDGEVSWFIFGCIFAFLISCPCMEIIFRKDVKALLLHPLQMVFNGICVIGIMAILLLDVFGYDTYIPNEDKVESYSVSIDGFDWFYSGSLHFDYSTYRMENIKIKDNESVRKLLEHAVSITRPARTGSFDMAEEGEYEYTSMSVRYNLKNGKYVYRNYLINRADEQVMQWVGDMYNDLQYKKGAYPILAENFTQNYIGIILDYAYCSEGIQLSKERMSKLVETYQKELAELSFEEIMTEYPIAKLAFAIPFDEGSSMEDIRVESTQSAYGFDYKDADTGYKIYPSFTETLALLKEYGAKPVNEIPVSDVTRIEIEDSSQEVDDHDGFLTKLVTIEYYRQPEEIAQILPSLVNNQLIGDYIVSNKKVESNIHIRVTYYYDGKEMYENFEFKKGEIPDFVIQDLKEAAH